MNETALEALAETGKWSLSGKWYMTGLHFLWVYDYFLTLGDEITCAWSGKKSRIFALFFAIRYSLVLYLVWADYTVFGYTDSFCKVTKWGRITIAVIVTGLAQMAVGLRVYAITDKNKLFAGALSAVSITYLSWGIYLIVSIAMGPMKPLPKIDLDAFKICLSGQWPGGGLIFTGLGIAFDTLAFSIIVVRARRRTTRVSGIPNLLDTIVRDATVYFIFIFVCQLFTLFFLAFAPRHVKFAFAPSVANSILTPIMASRLMLSLKKASLEPTGLWSIETMSTRVSKESEAIRFPSGTLGVDHRIPGILTRSAPDEPGGVELGPTGMQKSPRNHV